MRGNDNERNRRKTKRVCSGIIMYNSQKGFTLIEVLLTMLIISILGTIVFVAIGNQRQKARVTAALQSVQGVPDFAHECNFLKKPLSTPVAGNPICSGSTSEWPDVSSSSSGECDYDNLGFVGSNYNFLVICVEAGKKIACGISGADNGCKIQDL